MTGDGVPIQSVEMAIEILESLKEADERGVTAIAEETGLPTSTVHKHLSTLHELGLVHKKGRRYRVSASMLSYTAAVRGTIPHYAAVAEVLAEYSDVTNNTLYYFLPEGERCVCVFTTREESHYETGATLDLETSAPGEAIIHAAGEDSTLAVSPENPQPDPGAEPFSDDDGNVAVALLEPDGTCFGALVVHDPYQRQESGRYVEIAGQMRGMVSEIQKSIRGE